MKLTKSKIKQIIKEELKTILIQEQRPRRAATKAELADFQKRLRKQGTYTVSTRPVGREQPVPPVPAPVEPDKYPVPEPEPAPVPEPRTAQYRETTFGKKETREMAPIANALISGLRHDTNLRRQLIKARLRAYWTYGWRPHPRGGLAHLATWLNKQGVHGQSQVRWLKSLVKPGIFGD